MVTSGKIKTYYKLILLVAAFVVSNQARAQCPIASFYGDDGDGNTITCLTTIDTTTSWVFTFHNNSINGVSYDWDFGDGTPVFTTTSTAPIAHTYTNYGTYNVTLTVTGAGGCTVTDNVIAIFEKNVVASMDIPIAETGGCVPHTVNPINNSENAMIYEWDFGDGSPLQILTSLGSPTHTYNLPGCYTVTLTARNTCNSTVSTFSPIQVVEIDTAAFSTSQDTACVGDVVFFNNETQPFTCNGAAPNVSYEWILDDTSFGSNLPPQILNMGNHTAMLVACNLCGCDTAEGSVVIDTLPSASITINSSATGCSPLTFSSSTIASNNMTSHEWQIDGVPAYFTENMPDHVFTNTSLIDEIHTVRYIGTGVCGVFDTTFTLTVYPSVIADITPRDPEICTGGSVQFTDLSSGSNLTYSWDFGNGQTASTQGPHIITYNTAGVYNVRLIVNGNCGTDTTTTTVIVNDRPTADFGMPDTICRGTCLVMNNLSVGASSYYWDAPGSTPPFSNAAGPILCFNTPGNHTITLYSYSNATCADTISKPLVVNPFPFTSFTYNNVCLGDTVFFGNNSTIATSYTWGFDDGNVSSLEEPAHVYTSPGSYDVTLTANNAFNCPSSRIHTVTVDSVPTVLISAPDVCQGNSTVFTDLTPGTLGSWFWDFGDGDTSIIQNPVHSYLTADTFNVTLSVTTLTGCSSTGTSNAIVRPGFNSSISAPSDVCLGDPVNITTSSNASNIASSLINFGDGTSVSDTANATHIYSMTGIFNIEYIVVDNIGCSDTVNTSITVHPAINTNFVFNNGCLGDSVHFTDLSSGPVIGWNWDFGDGTSTTQQYPSHLYSTSGNFNVTLTITSFSGCTDTLVRSVMVSPKAIANFTADTVCAGDTTSFINVSTNSDEYMWFFGDASSDTSTNPGHVYSNPGVYSVTLFASNTYGCSDTFKSSVYSNIIPDAQFSASTVCYGETTTFIDSSLDATSWYWDFGNGNTSVSPNPTHVFDSSGINTVVLTVTNLQGCSNTDSSTAVVNELPTADFVFNPECVNQQVQFTDMSGANAIEWYWDFGDGNVDSIQNPVHTYTATGSYTVSLIIKPGVVCYDTIVKNINIQPEPTISASYVPACLGDTFNFTSVSTGNIISWNWDFGDGNIDTVENPGHVYSGDGNFTVIVTAYNNLGCVASDTLNVQVIPYISAGVSVVDHCFRDSIIISGTTNSGTVNWGWDLGDGNTSSVQNPNHVYGAPGDYIITLTVTDTLGCMNQDIDTVHVGQLPTADFTPDTTCAGNPTQFVSLSSGVGNLSHQWDFGGNVFSFSDSTSFTFGTPGSHLVKLTVISSEGCQDDTVKNVTVLGGFLVSYTSDTVCLGEPTTFTNLAPVTPDSLLWDFGDGSTSPAGQIVQHYYQNSGIYITSLDAIWNNGCSDQRYNLTHVWDSVDAQFDFTSSNFCEQEFVQFVNQSTGGYLQYFWDFGDGTSSTNFAPAHLYSNVGTYTITLAAVNAIGCSDTFSRTLTVSPTVTADFTNTVACPGQPIQFTDVSVNADNYFWDFGDNNYSTVQNPTHTYGVSTAYTVTLIASSSLGCADTIQRIINILPEVNADFNPVTKCGLDPMNFVDLSAGNPNSWIWEMGNTVYNVQNPVHTFDSTGSYPVKLIVTNSSGCIDSIVRNVSIYSIPMADFTADTVCGGTTTSFTNLSSDDNPMIFNWSFGDVSAPVYAINPNHLYANSGTYSVQLIASNIFGCRDTLLRDVLVTTSITAAFEADTACLGSNTTFDNLSSAGVGSVIWNFGDGFGQSTAFSPTYKYNAPGTYQVSLTINAFSGCSSSYTDSVRVNSVPSATFTYDNPCEGDAMSFNDSIISNGLACAVWDFGDGSPQVNGSKVTHTYQQAGNYSVQFRVCNTAGCEFTINQNIQVNPKPQAEFSADDVCEGLATVFDNQTQQQSGLSYLWEFGDNNISNVPSPNYTYASAGNYLASLKATNGYGCSDLFNRQVTVLTNPVAEFNADTVCYGESTSFTSINNTGVTDYSWDFGDNNSQNGNNPGIAHTYNNPGIYFATLTVSSNGKCFDNASRTVYVRNSVESDFIITDSILCLGSSLDAINTTLAGNVSEWVWHMGDSTFLNTQNVLDYIYTEVGSYQIELYANGNFCNVPKTIPLTVIENTNTAFTAENVCYGEAIEFTNYSSPAISYDWEFGDGSGSSDIDPVHDYLNPGIYVVTLTTNANSGCSSEFKDTLQVYPNPTAEFYPTVYETTINSQELQFIYTGIGGIDFFWDFGDGSSASGPSPTQNYVTAGNYEVGLTVWNQYGCEAYSEIENIDIKEFDDDIFVPSAFSPNNDNLNEKFYIVSENVASAYFAIYNRWGEAVFETTDITQGWDGTHHGEPLNPDVFVYYLKGVFIDGESFIRKGNITLVK